MITNEYEDQLKEWFNERRDESFLPSFCFKELPDCNQEVYEASLTDIELENYEDDKDKIDDDFMPEAKEENVKKDEQNFVNTAVEKVKNIRDNLLDIFDEFDAKVREILTKNLIENRKIRSQLDKRFKPEHYELFLNNWWIAALSIFVSMILPIIFVMFLSNNHRNELAKTACKPSSRSKTSKKALKVPKVVLESSESEAAEADDEKATVTTTRRSGRANKVLSTEPVKCASKRASKSRAE